MAPAKRILFYRGKFLQVDAGVDDFEYQLAGVEQGIRRCLFEINLMIKYRLLNSFDFFQPGGYVRNTLEDIA